MRTIPSVVLTHILLTGFLRAQEPRLIGGGTAALEHKFEFVEVTQLFELRDGRVVVLDRAEGEVRLTDFSGGTQLLGSKGMGPGEYTTPYLLLPLGGDSVGVYDDAGGRILVIQADGKVGGFVAATSTNDVVGRVGARFGDGRGYLYGANALTKRNSAGRPYRSDSLQLVRWRVSGGVAASIATMHYPPPAGMVTNEAGVGVPFTSEQPGSRNKWLVAPDGRIAIVHNDPYHVEIIEPSGKRRAGPPAEYSRVLLSESMKKAYLDERATATSGIVVSANGARTTVRRQAPARPATEINWARFVPPFRDNGFAAFDARGVLWVQRTTFHREGSKYDLFSRDGIRIDSVSLAEGHRVAGFGRNAMYVVRRNEDDLEFLQRRQLPR